MAIALRAIALQAVALRFLALRFISIYHGISLLRYIALLAKRIVGLCGVRARASDSCAFANHKHIVVDANALRIFEVSGGGGVVSQ